MTDITERLRALDTATCEDAADEITRLRNELHIAQEWSARVIARREQEIAEITALLAENERLMDVIAQLQEIVNSDTAEEERLRAEVERLNKSRNKWGQKYNKLLEKHKVTRDELAAQIQWVKDLADKLIEEEAKTSTLRAENERLRAALEPFACQCAVEAGPQCLFRNDGRCCNYTARAALEKETSQ